METFRRCSFLFYKRSKSTWSDNGERRFFGWKADSLTWAPFDTKGKLEKLNGYQKYGNNLIYGLIKLKEDTELKINVNDNGVNLVPFEFNSDNMEEDHSADYYIWYLQSETVINEGGN